MDVLLARERKSFERRRVIPPESDDVITSVMPSDFDGDSYMDLLVTRKPKQQTDDRVNVQIYWGQNDSVVGELNAYPAHRPYCQPCSSWNLIIPKSFPVLKAYPHWRGIEQTNQ